jgi:PAS domain S-box-containing protein
MIPVAPQGRSDAGRVVSKSLPTAAVIIADADLRILHAEGAAFDPRGLAVKDWPGRPLAEVLPAGLRAELEPRYRAALAGVQQSFEYSSADATSMFAAQITPVRAPGGAVTSVVAVMQDITEGLRVIEELSLSEARLRESERLVGVGSWELNPETGAITYCSGFARLVGLPVAGGLELPDFLALVRGEDREIVTEAIGECLKRGSAVCEFGLPGAGGAMRTVVAQGETVWATPGRPTYLRGALLDVTTAREQERERVAAVSLFRQGFDTAPIGMGLTDAQGGRYLRVNDAMCRLLGRSREHMMDASITSLTHPDDRAADDRVRQAMLDRTAPYYEVDKRYLRLDGSAVWATLHVAPVPSADGSVRAFGDDGLVIAPGAFLPVAERYGLISEIDHWVLRQAVELAGRVSQRSSTSRPHRSMTRRSCSSSRPRSGRRRPIPPCWSWRSPRPR